MKNIPVVLVMCLLVFSCTWVKLTEKGEKTRVLDAAEVIDCRKLGKTTSVSKAVVARMQRSKEKLQKELETLARNSAVDLKGDTVVPVGVPIDGKQVFEVYRCMP
jgi:hypothetical protein